jgi:hypothetical protein
VADVWLKDKSREIIHIIVFIIFFLFQSDGLQPGVLLCLGAYLNPCITKNSSRYDVDINNVFLVIANDKLLC